MKKSKALVFAVLMASLLFCLSGCFLFPKEASLNNPQIKEIGNMIYWEEISGATAYEIYVDGSLFETVSGDHYNFSDITTKTIINVKAINTDNDAFSKQSNGLELFPIPTFSQEEAYEIVLEDDKEFSIPEDVESVTISGTGINSYITIAPRSKDIIIELNGITLQVPEIKSGISYVIQTTNSKYYQPWNEFDATIILKGENSITCVDVTSQPEQPGVNKGIKGKDGFNGGSGISLPNVIIKGDGTLSLKGGNGGHGGKGSRSDGLVSFNGCGEGGNGGNGGYGILAYAIIINTSTGKGQLNMKGGEGGEKGAPGQNGRIVGMWSDVATFDEKYGVDGEDGKEYNATKYFYVSNGMVPVAKEQTTEENVDGE